MLAREETTDRPVTRALTLLGLTQEKVRARPDRRKVEDQFTRAREFRDRTQRDLLPLERPAVERELDHRLAALRVGALPFRKIPLAKLQEVLSWRDVETKLPVLAPFSTQSDRFSLMVDEWGRGWPRPGLPTPLVHVYADVYKLLNERRANRRVEVECKAMFQGLLPDDVRRMVMGVQRHFQDIRVLAEVDHWQIEEHERPALSDDPLVIGWDGTDFYLLAAFDLTPAEAAVERACLGTTPNA